MKNRKVSMKLCKNCKHCFKQDFSLRCGYSKYLKEESDIFNVYEVLTGDKHYTPTCKYIRENYCGRDAKYFRKLSLISRLIRWIKECM